MRNGIIISLMVILVIILSGCATSPPGVGVMDMDLVLQKSQRAQQLQQELSDIGNELEQNYNQKAQKLTGEKKQEELDKIYQQFLDNKQMLENQLNKEINQVIEELSKSRKLDIVLDKKDIHFGGIDITDEVIEKLDKGFSEGGVQSNGNQQ